MEMDRAMCESLVLSCIYQDLTLVNEVNLDYFSIDKTIFFYSVAKEMSKSIKEVEILAVNSWVASNGITTAFENYGGYQAIDNLLKLKAVVSNFDSYVDDLRKHVLIEQTQAMGIDLNKTYELNYESVNPLDVLPYMNAVQFGGLIQSIILENIGLKVIEHEDKFESLHYTEEEIEKIENGEENYTANFDVTMRYQENGEDRFIQSFKMLNDELNGLTRRNGVCFLGASSGSGKSTFALQMILGLIEDGEKVLLVSNEQQSRYFKQLLSAYVCVNVFKCYTISRKKISKWTLSDEEKEVWMKANKFIKEKYEGKLTFWAVNEFDFNKISNKMLKLKMTEGYRYLVLDTFKANLEANNVVNEYVQLSRDLDTFGRKNDIGVLCPIQLLSSTDRLSFLSSSQISGAKQIKEIASAIILFRKCKESIELNPDNSQYFLKPFVWNKNPITGKYEKKYLKIIDSTKPSEKNLEYDKYCVDINKRYRVVQIDKNRGGNDSLVYLYMFDGNTGRFTEKGLCDHINMGYLAQG